MGFFSSINTIYSNSDKFKQWEKNEEESEAKREALYKKNPPSAEILKEKQKLATTIIDTVSIMDQKSDDVAEDVEMATSMFDLIIPALSAVAMTAVGFVELMIKSKKDSKILNKSLEKLTPIIEDIKKANDRWFIHEHMVRNDKDKKIIIPNEHKEIVEEVQKEYVAKNKALKNRFKFWGAAILGTTILSYIATVIYTAKLQVGSSRIGRYQSRKDLEDPKNFVIYNDEQIKQAQEALDKSRINGTAKEIKVKEKTGVIDSFRNIKNLFRDKGEYDKWKKDDDQKDKRVKRELTPKEIETAQKDGYVIKRMVKTINNRAEEYAQNTQAVASTIMGSSILGGLAVGKLLDYIFDKTKTGERFAKFQLGILANKEIANEFEKYTKIDPKSPEYGNIKSKLQDKINKFFTDAVDNKKASLIDMTTNTTKLVYSHILTTKGGRALGVIGFSFFAATGIGAFITTKLTKYGGRAGRYAAKEEFKNNPQEFIGFDDKELKDIKGEKIHKKEGKIKEFFSFFPKVFKNVNDYQNYRNTEYKEKLALREELHKLEISDKQLKDAKNLQKKLFTTFEEIDDKSQEYSENMEALNEFMNVGISLGNLGAMLSPIIGTGYLVAKGKISVKSIINQIAKTVDKHTDWLKTKYFKNYIQDVTTAIKKKITSQKRFINGNKELSDLYKGVGFTTKALKKGEFVLNKKTISKYLEGISDEKTIDNLYYAIRDMRRRYYGKRKSPMPDYKNYFDYNKTMRTYMDSTKEEITNILYGEQNIFFEPIIGKQQILKGLIKNTKEIPKYTDLLDNKTMIEMYNGASKEGRTCGFMGFNFKMGIADEKFVNTIKSAISKLDGNIPKEEIDKAVDEIFEAILENPIKYMQMDTSEMTNCLATGIVKKTAIGTFVGFGALTTAVSMAIEAYFADMQKKAGRLGVMKAIESLEDPRFYADEYPNDEKKPEQKTKFDISSLLHKKTA